MQNYTFSCRKMFFAKRETNIWHVSRMHMEEGQKWGISHNIVILTTVITPLCIMGTFVDYPAELNLPTYTFIKVNSWFRIDLKLNSFI